MKSDVEIQRDVEAELRWRPEIDQTDIAVKVNQGVVNLSGFARTFLEKEQAEAAAKHVAGVTGVANDIEVRLPGEQGLTDPQVTRAAASAIQLHLPEVGENIKVLVHHGHVTLEGSVEWQFMKERAESAVRHLNGIAGVTNAIVIQPRLKAAEIQHRIEDAFQRNALIDANHVFVEAHGGEVTLKGKVRSWSERLEAQRTAWSAPGVFQVKNEITVSVA